MLEGLLHHKKEEVGYLCALIVTEDRIDAALWETKGGEKITVLKTSQQAYSGEWEHAIDAADRAVTIIEGALPKGAELTNVVFGLFPEWLSDDHIKDSYLKKLKQLTSALSLAPLGFVELPTAVIHLLQKDEGTQQTVILVGVESKHITVTLFKIGKFAGSLTQERGERVTADLEHALTSFTDVEVLPSRMLLFGSVPDLSSIKSELLDYPWQKKANFLHLPKIEVLPDDFPVRAVAVASSTEITPHTDEGNVTAEKVDTGSSTDTSAEVATIAEDLGFVAEENENHPPPSVDIDEDEERNSGDLQNVEPVDVPRSRPLSNMGLPKPRLTFPRLKMPKLILTFRFPTIPKLGVGVSLLVLFLLLAGGAYAIYWLLPSATVTILISPKTFDKTETITVDPHASDVDVETRLLPGKEVKEEISGSKSVPTTGKKIVGEKARGEVTIYNKTLNTKAFKKGALLTSGKLKFTLDEDISIASASESVGSLTYGTAKTNITASDIGTNSNVDTSTDLVFQDLPTSSYSARNDKPLSGGTSREISVVARDDRTKARELVTLDLEKQVESQVRQKIGSGEKLLENSVTSDITEESFSKEVGEEADELKIDVTTSAVAFAYNENDFFALLDKIVATSVPSNYEYKKENAKMVVTETSEGKDGARIFKTRITVELMPKLEIADLARRLAGRSLDEATDYLRSQSGVSGVEFSVNAPFAALKNKLPVNSHNITIEVSSL